MVAILLAAGLAVAPQVVRGNSCGHDFDFHLVSWMDALHAWRQGILYPQWAPSPNFNAGEPRFVFYPPLTWMLGAALGAVLPWVWVPSVLTFLLLAASGVATRALARQVLPNKAATLAGCIAIFSGYTLFTVYERSAFAELTGGIWIPLAMMLVLRGREPGQSLWRGVDASAVWLAMVVAGAWLSNAPVGVMTCYLLAGFAPMAAGMGRSWAPVARAAAGATLGLGFAGFYLLPAAVEQKWVDIRQATDDPGELIQNSFLFGRHADPQLALHDAELWRVSWIAIAMLGAVLVSLLVARRRGTLPGGKNWWVPLAMVPAGVLLLLLSVSLPLWDVLPKLRFLQFPWRWLVAVEAPLGIFVAAAVQKQGPGTRDEGQERQGAGIGSTDRELGWIAPAACGAMFLGLTVFAGRVFFQACDPYDAVPGMLQDYGNGGGYEGTDEYAPLDTDNSLVAEDLPAGCLVADPEARLGVVTADNPQPDWAPGQKSCLAALDSKDRKDARHWAVRGAIPQAGYLVLRLRRYPAWDVRVNGKPVPVMEGREDGLMAVPVEAGPVTVTADWRATEDALLGRWMTLIALTLVSGLAVVAWRRSRAQLK